MNRRRIPMIATVVAGAIAGSAVSAACRMSAAAATVSIVLPAQNTNFRPGPGREVAQRDCLTCHSAEYVTSQPALSAAVWTKEVAKMRGAYGASIPDADVDVIVNYLAAQNPGVKK